MRYVDGYVLPVPKKNLKAYRKMAAGGAKVWMDHGALQYCEAVGDDLDPPMGVSFPKQMTAKKGETIVFAFVVFKSRAHRDKVNKAVMKDPRLGEMMSAGMKMPFDCHRMCYGGFKTLVEG